jgi:hypothetical protein
LQANTALGRKATHMRGFFIVLTYLALSRKGIIGVYLRAYDSIDEKREPDPSFPRRREQAVDQSKTNRCF